MDYEGGRKMNRMSVVNERVPQSKLGPNGARARELDSCNSGAYIKLTNQCGEHPLDTLDKDALETGE